MRIFATALLAASVLGLPVERRQKGAAFYLAGDSTTATQSAGGGGWGDGFIRLLTNGASGKNFGKNGATTVSFRQGGFWGQVMSAVSGAGGKKTYVTIQFGHNDQKKDKGISDSQFESNLKKLAAEVKSKGATPVGLLCLEMKVMLLTSEIDSGDTSFATKLQRKISVR